MTRSYPYWGLSLALCAALLPACTSSSSPAAETPEPTLTSKSSAAMLIANSPVPPLPSATLPLPTPQPTPPAREFAIVGYLPDYRTLDPEWGHYVTDIVYFSAGLRSSGELDTGRLSAQTLMALREMSATYGTRVYVAIGGWARSENFAAVATAPDLRAQAVQAITAYCLENGLDGVDFDWEFPENAAERAGYVALLAEVRQAVAPHHMRVSVALAAWQDLGDDLYSAVDRIHVMAYDHEGRHSTFEQATGDIQAFIKRGAPPEKLLLGVPFYGRDVYDFSTALTYAEIVQRHHPAPDVDEAGDVYFNGITIIQRKTRYALEQQLGGVMIWELGQDTSDEMSLLRAIAQVTTHDGF
ncbi:MAG: glycosyl hydrolase family 18 protein [Anaerolineae bacterium]